MNQPAPLLRWWSRLSSCHSIGSRFMPFAVVLMAVSLGCGGAGDDGGESNRSTGTTAATTTSEAPTTTEIPSTSTRTPAEIGALIWQPITVEGESPPARAGAVMAAAPDGTLWLHGGLAGGTSLGDLWRFDGSRWELIGVAGAAPAARQDHVAVWDASRDALVIANGQDSSGQVFDDVWAFDPATATWSQLAQGGPAARYGSCAVVDEQGRMVITHGFSSTQRFDDTWAFDLSTSTWADISPDAGSRPVARCLHACSFDAESGELTLFGGRQDDDPYLGDTWRLAQGAWAELAVTGPQPRVRSRGAPIDSTMYVIGGTGENGLVGDAWVLGDGTWQPALSGAPTDRESAAVAQREGVVWLFGGDGASGDFGDLWRLG